MSTLDTIKENVENLIEKRPSEYDGERGLKLFEIDIKEVTDAHNKALDDLESANLNLVMTKANYEARIWNIACLKYLLEPVSIFDIKIAVLRVRPEYQDMNRDEVVEKIYALSNEYMKDL